MPGDVFRLHLYFVLIFTFAVCYCKISVGLIVADQRWFFVIFVHRISVWNLASLTLGSLLRLGSLFAFIDGCSLRWIALNRSFNLIILVLRHHIICSWVFQLLRCHLSYGFGNLFRNSFLAELHRFLLVYFLYALLVIVLVVIAFNPILITCLWLFQRRSALDLLLDILMGRPRVNRTMIGFILSIFFI